MKRQFKLALLCLYLAAIIYLLTSIASNCFNPANWGMAQPLLVPIGGCLIFAGIALAIEE